MHTWHNLVSNICLHNKMCAEMRIGMNQNMDERIVLCGANSYEQKYYLNPDFDNLPDRVKDELKIMCVLFTEDVGGIITLEYRNDGTLEFKVMCDDYDSTFDEIGCGLKIKQLQSEKRELLEALETYYKVFVLNMEE